MNHKRIGKVKKMSDFEKQIHAMFDPIWDCSVNYLISGDTIGELMNAVIQCYNNLASAEPDINAIKIAQEEAWKFANNISRRMSIGQREVCFGHGLISNILNALTYQEAKDKYEAYEKKAVLKIQLYDELLNDDGNKGVVVGENDDYYNVLWWNGSCGILYKNSDDFKKSGERHPEIADLLKQLRK